MKQLNHLFSPNYSCIKVFYIHFYFFSTTGAEPRTSAFSYITSSILIFNFERVLINCPELAQTFNLPKCWDYSMPDSHKYIFIYTNIYTHKSNIHYQMPSRTGSVVQEWGSATFSSQIYKKTKTKICLIIVKSLVW